MKSKKVFRADHAQTKSLVKAGRNAAVNAVRHSNALELPIKFIANDIIYEKLPDGSIIALHEIIKNEIPLKPVKGMVLHGKKQ